MDTNRHLSAHDLRIRTRDVLTQHGVNPADRRTWPYDKTQRMIGSSSIIVSYPPKRILPQLNDDTGLFTPTFSTSRVSVYVHVPVCTGRCRYCGFMTWQQCDVKPGKYIQAVLDEMKRVERQSQVFSKSEVASLYFGGGTPTALDPDLLKNLIQNVKDHITLAKNAEVTVEASPETLRGEVPALLKALDVTRVSVGIQTFAEPILEHMHRRHTRKDAIDAIEMLRSAGHDNVNIDLIEGYPGMTMVTVADDLATVSDLQPDSVTTYELVLRDDSVLLDEFFAGQGKFLSPESQIEQSLAYDTGLLALGYEVGPAGWYTLRPEARYRQQAHKWGMGIPMLAFGNSAYGFFNSYQYYNLDLWDEYVNSIAGGHPAVSRAFRLNSRELLHRRLVFGIKAGIEYPFPEDTFLSAISPQDDLAIKRRLERLIDDCLVDQEGNRFALSALGRVFSEQVAREFYSDTVLSHDMQHAALPAPVDHK